MGELFRRVAVVGGLAGVIYFAIQSTKDKRDRFNWLGFFLMAFLGFGTFGLATLLFRLFAITGLSTIMVDQSPMQLGSARKSESVLQPGAGLWWSFAENQWNPNLLEAMQDAPSTKVALAMDGIIFWKSDLKQVLDHAGMWMASEMLKLDQSSRDTPNEFARLLELKMQFGRSEITTRQFSSRAKELVPKLFHQNQWPSNWCSRVNASYTMAKGWITYLFSSISSQQVADLAISRMVHAQFLARCQLLECDRSANLNEHVDHENHGSIIVRSVECPGTEDCHSDEHSEKIAKTGTKVMTEQENYLAAAILMQMASQTLGNQEQSPRHNENPLAICREEWKEIADRLAETSPVARKAILKSRFLN